MKITHVITRLIVGGAQENTLLSCEGQHDRGHGVTLITGPAIGPEGSLMERAQNYGYRVIILDSMRRSILPGKDWRVYRELRKHFRDLTPDVVHTHSSKAGIIGRFAAWKENVPLVVHTIHGLSWTSSSRAWVNDLYKRLERAAAKRCHKIVVVADAMTKQSLAANIGQPGQYVTVYSGMETGPFFNPPIPRETMRKQLGLEEDDVAVCTIARLFEKKGHEDLLEHAHSLCEKHPNLKFVWVGDGNQRENFEAQIADLKLEDRFKLVGLVPPGEVCNTVNACDILAHPSRREGLARALPQGQLAGLPVVTYDIDGNAEGLIEGETGWAVKAFDVPAFIERISQLAGDAEKRKTMGEKGRAFALGRFDAQVMVEGLERVYEPEKREVTKERSSREDKK